MGIVVLPPLMHKIFNNFVLILLLITSTSGNGMENKVLNVGNELLKETLPLQMGSRYYQLQGLKPFMWYEVKISYPASIPAIFSLQLRRGSSVVGMHRLRKLLNTEKLIFKTESLDEMNAQSGIYVLVTVEPEGVVAIPGVREREDIIFNIVCDELILGIPHKAWLVAFLALVCVILGFLVPQFLPPLLLPKGHDLNSVDHIANKNS